MTTTPKTVVFIELNHSDKLKALKPDFEFFIFV